MILDAARNIAEREGLAGLTTRAIADAIGYSSGTLYNLFTDLDDIVVHLNGTTLDELSQRLAAVPSGDNAEATLHRLADCYMAFVASRPRLWGLLFQDLPNRSARPDWYYGRMDHLFAQLEGALDPLFSPVSAAAKRDAARIVWSGVHGMCTLAAEGAVLSWADARRLSAVFIANFVSGLRRSKERRGTKDRGRDSKTEPSP
jgi:AcrR family transcriptional regulator